MELFKPVSPSLAQITATKSRSSSCTEATLFLNSIDTPFKIDTSGKFNHSELVNKFILMPNDLFTFGFNVLDIDDTFILRNIVCYIFKIFFICFSYHYISGV